MTTGFGKPGKPSSNLQVSYCPPSPWDEDAGCRFVGQDRGTQGAVLSDLLLAVG